MGPYNGNRTYRIWHTGLGGGILARKICWVVRADAGPEPGWNRRLGSEPSLAGSSPYGVYLSVTREWGVANKTSIKAHWITELLGPLF